MTHRYGSKRASVAGTWYHGDAHQRGTHAGAFDDQHMDRPRDQDPNAMGPGIYFTRSYSQARGYAWPSGWVYTARVKTTPSRVLGEDDPPKRDKVLALVRLASSESRETGLSDWAENPAAALRMLTEACLREEKALDAYLMIRKGFFDSPEEYARAMVAVGYDAFLHHLPEVDHLIVWNPGIIQVLAEEKYVPED